jgi:hypothetical protein
MPGVETNAKWRSQTPTTHIDEEMTKRLKDRMGLLRQTASIAAICSCVGLFGVTCAGLFSLGRVIGILAAVLTMFSLVGVIAACVSCVFQWNRATAFAGFICFVCVLFIPTIFLATFGYSSGKRTLKPTVFHAPTSSNCIEPPFGFTKASVLGSQCVAGCRLHVPCRAPQLFDPDGYPTHDPPYECPQQSNHFPALL